MKDFWSVCGIVASRGGKTIYSAVNTNDPNQIRANVENPASLDADNTFSRFLFRGRLDRRQRSKYVCSTMLMGLIALLVSSVIIVVNPYDIIFSYKVKMSEGSESLDLWATPPVELFLKVYLFNVTNREAFLAGKEKLRVQEVGPYVYREGMAHVNVSMNDNGTVTATPIHPLTWSFANVMAKASLLTRMGVNLLIKQTKTYPLVEQTAREFMFGYESALVTLGNKFMPSWIAFDKLGLIDRMYDFTGDVSTTYTGEGDLKKAGLFATYNRRPFLPQWDLPCGNVDGASDGTKFPTKIKKDDQLLFFRKSLCRAVPMERVSEEYEVSSLPVYKYNFKKGSLDNGYYNQNNSCFCRRGYECLRRGLIDVTDCYYGFPIALSYPHFMESDPWLNEEVLGTEPDPEKHTTVFVVNPQSGLPLEIAVRMQINIALNDLSSISNAGKFSNMVLPLLWTEIGFQTLPDSLIAKFYFYLKIGPAIQTFFIYLLLISGIASILLSIAASCYVNKDQDISPNFRWRTTNEIVANQAQQQENKKRQYKNDVPTSNNCKEMETYYCSLLTTTNEKDLENDLMKRLEDTEDETDGGD
ncbi:hypothetical protein M8J76_006424 [Diaphorina citri]|nr:hypothetical protein M8J76_006424 [Diaphorina citri]